MKLEYKGFDVGTRRVDFFIEEKLMLEIKAVIELEDVHLAQAINYLEAYGLKTGLLINFGSTTLQFKRIVNRGCVLIMVYRGIFGIKVRDKGQPSLSEHSLNCRVVSDECIKLLNLRQLTRDCS